MATVLGAKKWEAERDEDGHRTYNIDWLVRAGHIDDGPRNIMQAAGLPAIGSPWSFGNDNDPWAFCWPTMKVHRDGDAEHEPDYFWIVEQEFTTKPFKRCQDIQVENPISESPKISGAFVNYLKKMTRDRDGMVPISSSLEPMELEVDASRPTVSIELNKLTLPLVQFAPMTPSVNDAPMWGLPEETIKLAFISWERNVYGSCNFYYTIRYEFDIKFETFYEYVADVGTRVLLGHSPGSSTETSVKLNPTDTAPLFGNQENRYVNELFEAYKTKDGDKMSVLLDGYGRPVTYIKDFNQVYFHRFAPYPKHNFFALGIPPSL